MRLLGVNLNVAVQLVLTWLREPNLLQPTMGATDWVGLHRVGEVLMDSSISPIDAVGVWVGRLPRAHTFDRSHPHLAVAKVGNLDCVC
jgi:hypothetical protein